MNRSTDHCTINDPFNCSNEELSILFFNILYLIVLYLTIHDLEVEINIVWCLSLMLQTLLNPKLIQLQSITVLIV